ncbi:MAG: LacI family DNA-binding transcriptional regulator [Spirochaetes bacterium]|jgi:LacI family transcriptional regulator|nr:LacI family DNA-binding transcriptional regulator [Spirochaetota bacterium]
MGIKNERARRLEDIARRCGVSISSVSRVLNNEPGVSADTRRRVLAAAGQQEFRPRPRKRHLSRALLDLLVVIPEEEELSANPFLNISELAGAIGEAFRDEKKRIEVAPIGDFLDSIGRDVAGVDGVLFAYRSVDDLARRRLAELKIPYVFVSRVIPGENYVSCNYYKSMLGLTRMMIDSGHRRLGYLGNAGNPNDEDRFRGFQTAVAEAGSVNTVRVSASSIFGVDENAVRLFTDGRCDAVLCFNDFMAIRLIGHLRDLGLTVPSDISVTGFDDSPLRRVASPLLTTVRQPTSEMAFLASRWLRDNILHKSNRRLCIEVEGEIMPGESTRARG